MTCTSKDMTEIIEASNRVTEGSWFSRVTGLLRRPGNNMSLAIKCGQHDFKRLQEEQGTALGDTEMEYGGGWLFFHPAVRALSTDELRQELGSRGVQDVGSKNFLRQRLDVALSDGIEHAEQAMSVGESEFEVVHSFAVGALFPELKLEIISGLEEGHYYALEKLPLAERRELHHWAGRWRLGHETEWQQPRHWQRSKNEEKGMTFSHTEASRRKRSIPRARAELLGHVEETEAEIRAEISANVHKKRWGEGAYIATRPMDNLQEWFDDIEEKLESGKYACYNTTRVINTFPSTGLFYPWAAEAGYKIRKMRESGGEMTRRDQQSVRPVSYVLRFSKIYDA